MTAERPREVLAEVIVDLATVTDAIVDIREREGPESGPSLGWMERMLGQIADDLDSTWDDERPHARVDSVRQLDRAGAVAIQGGWPEMAEALDRLAASLRRLGGGAGPSTGYGSATESPRSA